MNFRRSIRTRFALILSSLMAALVILIGSILIAVRARDQRLLLETNARGFAETTKRQLCEIWKLYYWSGSYKFREQVRQTQALNQDLHRILILSVSGEVHYDSFESPELTLRAERVKRRLEDPELVRAAALPTMWVKTTEIPGRGEALFIVAPFFEEWGRHPYSVLYVFTYEKLHERVRESVRSTLLLTLLAVGVVAAVSSYMARKVVGPILRLTGEVRKFSEGSGEAVKLVATGDEIEELSRTFNEMTERIRTQVEKLEQANKELATLDRMKTDLLANVSHELRTPLAAIRGYVEFLLEGRLGPVNDQQRKALDVSLRNADRLTKTINMLLDFSRMELGRVTIRPAPFQVGRLIAQVVSGIEKEAERRKVRLTMRLEPELRAVEADRDRITQVLENLVTNALKFTPEGGWVEVGARPSSSTNKVEIWVSDTGVGIPLEQRQRVFEKFFQLDATPTRKFGGIGLGLAIVKSILDAHNSEIEVDERVGGGTVFRFSLPAVHVTTESGIFYGFLPVENAAAEILAIDDDEDFLALIKDTLSSHGYAVRVATTAGDGLAMAKERTPRLILLDIRLPDRDGLDLLYALKHESATKDVPILIVSVVDERIEGKRLGAVEYLVKPIDRAKLIEAASRALGKKPTERMKGATA
ncbi:MAG: ATP-binding protein [Thermoanaerobaculia bacterium]|nr:ATP-binding protein [Thermoanaerobaculia bacterium]